jgi:hypothetical protein
MATKPKIGKKIVESCDLDRFLLKKKAAVNILIINIYMMNGYLNSNFMTLSVSFV